VFQAFDLMPYRTATENLALAQVYHGTSRAWRLVAAREALRRVGLAHRADALPTQLSGGERQRVAIARALVNRPSLLLCDEPTGNLDAKTADTVADLLLSLSRETILIGVTHSQHLAQRFGRSMCMTDGELADA